MTANQFIKELILPQEHEYEELTAVVSSTKNATLIAKAEQVSNEKSAQVNAGSLTSFV